jgi:hypothetical protein
MDQLMKGMVILHDVDAVGRVPEQLAEMGDMVAGVDG